MARNDKQIRKLSEEIKGTLKSLFEMGPVQNPNDPMVAAGLPGQDPMAPANLPGQDPMNPMGGPTDPMNPMDPMAPTGMEPQGMGLDDLNSGDPTDPNAQEAVPVPEADQANLNAIGTTPAGEAPGSADPQKVIPQPDVNILGTENRDQTTTPLPNFVLEAFGNEEKATKMINYLVERVVMNYDVKKGGNTTHGEQELHDVIIDKLAKFLEKKQEESSDNDLELKKDLAGLDKKTKEIQEENIEIKTKYISLLKEFSEVLTEAHTYLKRNELNWKVYSLAIPDERKAQAVREMSSLSLTESELYLKRLQKLEESSSPSAQPRRYNAAGTAELREYVRQSATVQDEKQKKPLTENATSVLTSRMLRNAGIPVEEEDY